MRVRSGGLGTLGCWYAGCWCIAAHVGSARALCKHPDRRPPIKRLLLLSHLDLLSGSVSLRVLRLEPKAQSDDLTLSYFRQTRNPTVENGAAKSRAKSMAVWIVENGGREGLALCFFLRHAPPSAVSRFFIREELPFGQRGGASTCFCFRPQKKNVDARIRGHDERETVVCATRHLA